MLIPMIKKISMELKIEFSGYFSGDSNMCALIFDDNSYKNVCLMKHVRKLKKIQ